jgi:hypothetical protein
VDQHYAEAAGPLGDPPPYSVTTFPTWQVDEHYAEASGLLAARAHAVAFLKCGRRPPTPDRLAAPGE